MKDKANDDLREIVRRLDAILGVLLEGVPTDGKKLSMTRRVEALYTAGLRPAEIARILGKTSGYVNVELHRLKKSQKKRS